MKILAALDISDYAQFVLAKAIRTARQQDAKLDIMVVVEEESEVQAPGAKKKSADELLEEANRAARSYLERAQAQGVHAKARVRSGRSAADEIIRYQQAEQLDLIVLGRASPGHKSDSPMGPVARRVTENATCTVMVVRCMEKRDFA
ncbi:MAG: universal stress protein [Desulfobulbaceae bacterium]